MKVAICSDLHLEFETIELKNPGGVDVLILSGDILVANDLDKWDETQAENGFARRKSVMYHKFMQNNAEQFPHVIYIAGNHEHYHGDYATTLPHLKESFSYLKNVHVLDKECVTIDDVTFIGGTLWTDMNKEDPITLLHMTSMMNDFRIVANSNRRVYKKVPVYKKDDEGNYVTEDKNGVNTVIQIGMKMREETAKFSPQDAVDDHKAMVEYIRTIIEGKFDQKFVVVGHHAPSRNSTHPRYKDEVIMNGGYSSSLDEFIMDHPQIKLWTHGHTHELFDYMLGTTRITCNPRGYAGYEDRADMFELQVVEV